jgi:hypothetical protein
MATVTCVLLPDTRQMARVVERRCTADPATLFINVPPTLRAPNMAIVLDTVLFALGKDDRLSHLRRDTGPLALAWLSLKERTDAVVADAGQFGDKMLDRIIELFASHEMDVWLLFRSGSGTDHAALGERIDGLIERWGGAIVEEDHLHARWPDQRQRSTKTKRNPEPAGLPVLPRVDGVFFRRALQQTLRPAEFAVIDARLAALVKELRTAIRAAGGNNKSRRLENLLRNRMHDVGDFEELHLLVRAMQIAGMCEGFNVKVSSRALYGASVTVPRRGQAVSEGWWEVLDQYRDPDIGATGALYLTDVDPDTISTLPIKAVDASAADQVIVHLADRDVVIAGPEQRFLRALLAWRYLADASPEDPLFATHRDRAKLFGVRRAYISAQSRRVAEVGIRLGAAEAKGKFPSAQQWLRRYGISISKLTKDGTANRVASTKNKSAA